MRPLRVTPRPVDPYDRGEVARLLASTAAPDRVVPALAALAGLRQGEVFAIRRSDVDLPGRVLMVRRSLQRHYPGFSVAQRLGPPKTTTGFREVPIQATLEQLLAAQLESHQTPNRYDLLCPTASGEPHLPIVFHRRVYAAAVKRAGLRPMRFHDLRRSFIAQCVEAGVPAAQTAAWLGHTIRMTEHYYHAGRSQRARAVDLLDATATR